MRDPKIGKEAAAQTHLGDVEGFDDGIELGDDEGLVEGIELGDLLMVGTEDVVGELLGTELMLGLAEGAYSLINPEHGLLGSLHSLSRMMLPGFKSMQQPAHLQESFPIVNVPSPLKEQA